MRLRCCSCRCLRPGTDVPQLQNSTRTLDEGLAEYHAANPHLLEARDLSPAAAPSSVAMMPCMSYTHAAPRWLTKPM